MLTVQDIKKVAIGRFYRTGIQKFRDLILVLSVVWLAVWMVGYLVGISLTAPNSYVQYSIPNSMVESGEDIEITYTRYIGYSVDGYLLKDIREHDNSDNVAYALILVIALLPVLGAFIWVGVSEYKCNNYVDATVQRWVETKEI